MAWKPVQVLFLLQTEVLNLSGGSGRVASGFSFSHLDTCGSSQFVSLSSHTITKTTPKFILLGSEEAVGGDGVGGSRGVSWLRLGPGGQHRAGPEPG